MGEDEAMAKRFPSLQIACAAGLAATAAQGQSGDYLEVAPGVALYYEAHGEGAPLVFVPGWTFTTASFEHQIDVFDDEWRVITFDPRSHGRSTVTTSGNEYITQGADLKALLTFLEAERPVLVGWSFGCLATWQYVLDNGPQSVAAHVCIDLPPEAMTSDETDWTEGPVAALAAGYQMLRTVEGHRDLILGYAANVMLQEAMSPETTDFILRQSMASPPWVAQAYWAAGMFSNYLETAQALEAAGVPSLMVIAEHWADTAVPYMARTLPATQTAVLGGHMMFWEQPEPFNALLLDFLNEIDG